MKNADTNTVFEKRQEILQKIDISSILESAKASTINGDKYISALKNHVNEGRANTITAISGIASQCMNQYRNDQAVFQIGESLVEKLNESIDPMIVFCFESVQGQSNQGNTLATQLSGKLESLLVMESMKDKTSAIRTGLLNPYKLVNESVSLLQNSVSIKSEAKEVTAIHEASNPIVYIENINESTYLRLGTNVFSMTDSNLVKTVSPSAKFTFLSSIVEELSWNDAKESFVYEDTVIGKFFVNENSIERTTDNSVKVFEKDHEFVKQMSILTESFDNKRIMESSNRLCDSLISVKNNFESFVKADNIVLVENKNNYEKYALVVLENSSFVCTLQSVRYPNIVEKFDRIDSALETLKKKSGYSADGFVTEQLSQLNDKNDKQTVLVESYTSILESLHDKEQEIINAMDIAKRSNQPNKLSKLNESLSLVRSHITEQKNNFGLEYSK